jgi:hypothetical protein
MSLVMNDTRISRERATRRQYRLLFAAGFPLFFVAALVLRVAGQAGTHGQLSLFSHAKALAGATIPMVFMG